MRTTLELDDHLVLALQQRHPDLSKTDAIELAMREYLAATAADRFRALAGTMKIEDLSEVLRQADRKT